MAKTDLTAVVITKNEEACIKECLESLSFADKILVVDDESIDKTCALAKEMGAEVINHKMENFVKQRNYALAQVKTEWVLFVDADERVSTSLAGEIKKALGVRNYNAFAYPRKNIIFGKWIKHSGWYPDLQTHLFRTKKGKYVAGVHEGIHEQVEVNGNVGNLKNNLLHDHYQSIFQYIGRMNFYTNFASESLTHSDYKFSFVDLFNKPMDEFLRRYFAEKGYLDGLHGLALCFLQAISELVVYLKVWEKKGFEKREISLHEVDKQMGDQGNKLTYWFTYQKIEKAKHIHKIILRAKRKIVSK